MLEKGNVYWYKYRRKVYCCAILEITNNNDYLIAISEELNKNITKPNEEEARESKLYTLAWFDNFTVLPPYRLHLIFKESLCVDYNNRAGLWIDEKKHVNQNPGSGSVWKHEHRNYALRGAKLGDTFTTYFIPPTFIYD